MVNKLTPLVQELRPDIKIFWTIRGSVDEWFESYSFLMTQFAGTNNFPLGKMFDFRWFDVLDEYAGGLMTETFVHPLPWVEISRVEANPAWKRATYTRLLETLCKQTPKNNFLELELKKNTEGYQPLCGLLEVAQCPSGEFPHKGERATLEKIGVFLEVLAYVYPLLVMVPSWMLYKMCL